jgi:hypothetical protein
MVQPAKATPAVRTRPVGAAGEFLDGVEGIAAGGAGAGGLEDVEAAGDAPPAFRLLRPRREHVVGHQHRPGVDSLGAQPAFGHPEVHDVAGVVAEGEEDPGTAIGGPGDAVGLLAGGAGEDVADGGGCRHPLPDQAVEGGVMAGAAADDDRDPARPRRPPGDHAGGVRHLPQEAAEGGRVAVDHLLAERRGVVQHPLHVRLLRLSTRPR